MVIDTSAIVAIVRSEADGPGFARAIERNARRRISAGTLVEIYVVLDRFGDPILHRQFEQFTRMTRITIEPVDYKQALIARSAHRDFGRGSGHPASLNYGDCFSYALAMHVNEPLLFKGNDFIHTDVRTVPIDL